jgi:hypothetical protein
MAIASASLAPIGNAGARPRAGSQAEKCWMDRASSANTDGLRAQRRAGDARRRKNARAARRRSEAAAA